MAKPTSLLLIDKNSNLIISSWKGISYLRSRPAQVRQTVATKVSSSSLATASKMGAAVRSMLAPLLPLPADKQMRDRFTGAIKKWLQTAPLQQSLPSMQLPYLQGFEFNRQSLLESHFRVPLQVQPDETGNLLINLPAFKPTQLVTAPAGTRQLRLQMMLVCYNLSGMQATGSRQHDLLLPYNSNCLPNQTISIPVNQEAGSCSLLALSLQYIGATNGAHTLQQRPEGRPCALVAGIVY